MELLKKENWWVNLLLTLFTDGFYSFILGIFLKVYNKDAWYTKWYYWGLGLVCLIFPAFIMLAVFSIQISIEVAKKLDVPGKEIYASPYVWIICVIVPIIGWVFLAVLSFYLTFWPIVMLAKGNGEKYLNN